MWTRSGRCFDFEQNLIFGREGPWILVWLLEQNTPSGVLKQQKCTLSLLGARNRKPGCLWAVLPGGSRGALLVSFRFKGAGILGCGGILSHHVLPVRLCVSWGSRDTGLGSTPLHCDLVFSSYTCKTPLSKSGHILSFWEGRQFGGFAVSPAELARGLFNPGPGAPHPPCPPPSEAWRGVQGLGALSRPCFLSPQPNIGRLGLPHGPSEEKVAVVTVDGCDTAVAVRFGSLVGNYSCAAQGTQRGSKK